MIKQVLAYKLPCLLSSPPTYQRNILSTKPCGPNSRFGSLKESRARKMSSSAQPSAIQKKKYRTITHAHSKQLFTGHLCDACANTSDIVLIKIMTRAPGVEIRIAFLICYLQSLYEIELGHYFCPEFAVHVTNQNILVDAGKLK